MRPTVWLACLILGLSILVAPRACAQKTSTSYDDKFSFSQHTRYAWRGNRLMTRQHPDTNEVMNLKIVKAVNHTLNARGFVEVKEKPDFYLYYDGGGDVRAVGGGEGRVNSTPLSPNDFTPTYGLGNGPTIAPSTWLKVNGEIVFYMIDAESGKPVWETIYSKTFHDPNKALRNMDKEVNELVSKSFKNFPPKSPK
jgi:Domain of unknown function (DUF4136)